MKRAELEHVLRAASRTTGEREMLVLGSQSVLGSVPEDELPDEAVTSIEVDIAFLDDPENVKADQVDGAIGELSSFHESFGYCAHGIGAATATLPAGWQKRLIPLANANTAPGRGLCIDPHDCVVAKLVAGRSKDTVFAGALIRAGLVSTAVLAERVNMLTGVHPSALERIRRFLACHP